MKKYMLVGALLACVPGAALAQSADPAGTAGSLASNFAGPRIEARIGWETPTISGSGDAYKIGQAVSLGGEVGFDIAAGNSVVVGPYANYEISNVELCEAGDCLEVDSNLGAGLQAGIAVSPRALLYAKAGYARIKVSATSGGESESDTADGAQGALGFELSFSPTVYGRFEASYADYGKFYGINLNRRHVAASLGFRF